MFSKDNIKNLPYYFLAILIIFFLSTHHANYVDYDAPSYINFTAIRPPLYPFFIWLFKWAGNYQYTIIIWLHGLLTFASFLYARKWLSEKLHLSTWLIFAVLLITTITILFHFQLLLIGSEGLTLPLFIYIFFLLVDCFKQYDTKKILFLAIATSLLLLIRLQFYYLYAILSLLCFWYIWQKTPFRKILFTISIFLASIICTFGIDHTYHLLKHGINAAPATGQLLIVQPLFLTNQVNAPSYFKNPEIRSYLQDFFNQINLKQLNTDADLTESFKISYYELAYESYTKHYQSISDSVTNALNTLPPQKANEITKEIAFTLIKHDLKKNLFFFAWKFIQFIGGIPVFIFLSLFLMAILAKIFISPLRMINYSDYFIFLSLLVIFLNAAVIAIFEISSVAYFCYSQFIFYCFTAFLIEKCLYSETKTMSKNYTKA